MFIGDKTAFDDDLQKKMLQLERDSKDFNAMTLLIAVNYGGRDEIVRAAKKIVDEVQNGDISSYSINEESIASHLDTKGIPDVDLVIRPSGELRLSNFLIWQSA
jgi:undecaprenyl diphosphate synthase